MHCAAKSSCTDAGRSTDASGARCCRWCGVGRCAAGRPPTGPRIAALGAAPAKLSVAPRMRQHVVTSRWPSAAPRVAASLLISSRRLAARATTCLHTSGRLCSILPAVDDDDDDEPPPEPACSCRSSPAPSASPPPPVTFSAYRLASVSRYCAMAAREAWASSRCPGPPARHPASGRPQGTTRILAASRPLSGARRKPGSAELRTKSVLAMESVACCVSS